MIFFLIPTYNESENIELLYQNISLSLPKIEKKIVFVDDCSTDNTIEKIKQLFPENLLHIITKETNKGPGDSFNIGFDWILSHSTNMNDRIVTMEADNTSDLSILPTMISISQLGFDLVLASVYAQGGGFDKTSIFRKTISLFANMIFRSIFNIKILTLSSFYRVYSISLIQKIAKNNTKIIGENGFISMLEILIKSIQLHAQIIEVPMTLRSEMRKGKSKMKVLKTMKAYLKFLFKYSISRKSFK